MADKKSDKLKKNSDKSSEKKEGKPEKSVKKPEKQDNKSEAAASVGAKPAADDGKSGLKRLPVGSVKLMFAGELIMARSPGAAYLGLFRRYEALFEAFANMSREDRLLNYRLINALMLTSYAKKVKDVAEKKKLFDLKNELFLLVANDRASRRKLQIKYLASKNFRVISYCADCTKKNTEAAVDKRHWKYCRKCHVDKNFYNVLAISHLFPNGGITLFLSNELVPQVKGLDLKELRKGKIDTVEEEALYQQFHYNVRNLDAFELDSIMAMNRKVAKNA